MIVVIRRRVDVLKKGIFFTVFKTAIYSTTI